MIVAVVTALTIVGLYATGWVLGGALAELHSWWEERR